MEDDLQAEKPLAATLHPICLHFGQTKTIRNN